MTGLAAVGGFARRAGWRLPAFLGLWLILFGADPAGLPVGIAAAIAATWTSLHLLPPGGSRSSPKAVARLALRFLYQSVVAGIDVALRALDPRLPLRPGFRSRCARCCSGWFRGKHISRF